MQENWDKNFFTKPIGVVKLLLQQHYYSGISIIIVELDNI